MASKYYAVVLENGNNYICNTWKQCLSLVKGVPNAKFKKFSKREQAKEFINKILGNMNSAKTQYSIYIDGSFNTDTNMYGTGLIVVKNNKEIYRFKDTRLDRTGERNINGELLGALYAMQWGIKAKQKEITIIYDYAGIQEYAIGTYTANTKLAKFYLANYKKYSEKIKIYFQKVKGHSNNYWNDEVDLLAKSACEIK